MDEINEWKSRKYTRKLTYFKYLLYIFDHHHLSFIKKTIIHLENNYSRLEIYIYILSRSRKKRKWQVVLSNRYLSIINERVYFLCFFPFLSTLYHPNCDCKLFWSFWIHFIRLFNYMHHVLFYFEHVLFYIFIYIRVYI